MSLDKDQVQHIAMLARLRLADEEFAETVDKLSRIVDFLDMKPDAEHIKNAVEFASVDNLRKMEKENYFWRSGSRVQAKDVNDPNTTPVANDSFADAQAITAPVTISGYVNAAGAGEDGRIRSAAGIGPLLA